MHANIVSKLHIDKRFRRSADVVLLRSPESGHLDEILPAGPDFIHLIQARCDVYGTLKVHHASGVKEQRKSVKQD